MAVFRCVAARNQNAADAQVEINADRLTVRGQENFDILYADICDLRLLHYRLKITLREGTAEFSFLGHQTEDFFEKLWQAYEKKSREALLLSGEALMTCEGDYAISEPGLQKRSIARLTLYPDCLCIVPHDKDARRFPFCFARVPVREGYFLSSSLDTAESFRIGRLGKQTEPFFAGLTASWAQTQARWAAAHKALARGLAERLGERQACHAAFSKLGVEVVCGLFAANDEAFWFAAVGRGRAAVEFVTGEDAATYLYRFDLPQEIFLLRLRHAMEAVRTNRRLIMAADEELAAEPLWRMALDRSAHVRFLRGAFAGRIIHNSGWEGRLRAFFGR